MIEMGVLLEKQSHLSLLAVDEDYPQRVVEFIEVSVSPL